MSDETQTEKQNISTIITVFGATGDLASRKIFPSLWHLFERNKLPKHTAIIGIARSKLSDEDFRQIVGDSIKGPRDSTVDKN